MSATEILLARDEDGLPVNVAVIAAQLAADAAAPPVIAAAWKLYVCWAKSGRMGPLPGMSDDDEATARDGAVRASLQKGVRYAALFNGPGAWPAAVYMNGAELDDEAAEEAYLAG